MGDEQPEDGQVALPTPHRGDQGGHHSLRSTVAAGIRAAVQPGPAAIRLATSRVAGTVSSTNGTGTSAWLATPGRGERHPGPAPGQHAE